MQKQCQNCKKEFEIASEDQEFYAKISVPTPTFCSDCRLQRRMVFANERTLYKRNCDLCKDSIVSWGHKITFSVDILGGSYNVLYSDMSKNSPNIFGCIGLRNKQYTKEEYEDLVPKIIEHMG